MVTRVLFAAVLAGVLAGVAVSAIHFTRLVPLIIEAERLEAAPHGHGTAAAHSHAPAVPAQGRDADLVRNAKTLVANLITGMGFAFLLVAAILVSGRAVSARTGAVWGLAGFAVVSLAPAIGLAPELPGMPAADLAARQLWWVATVAASAVGGWLVVFVRFHAAKALGVALILAPHVVGAPQPEFHASDVPAHLAAAFAAASLGAAAVFWLVLGTATGWLLGRGAARAA